VAASARAAVGAVLDSVGTLARSQPDRRRAADSTQGEVRSMGDLIAAWGDPP